MLQIGRKIYYEKSTGNVILDTGERMGDVRETIMEEDLAVFSQLQGIDPSTVDIIRLSYGECAEEFLNIGSIHVDPETKALNYPC